MLGFFYLAINLWIISSSVAEISRLQLFPTNTARTARFVVSKSVGRGYLLSLEHSPSAPRAAAGTCPKCENLLSLFPTMPTLFLFTNRLDDGRVHGFNPIRFGENSQL